MLKWELTAFLPVILALFYLACQADTTTEPAAEPVPRADTPVEVEPEAELEPPLPEGTGSTLLEDEEAPEASVAQEKPAPVEENDEKAVITAAAKEDTEKAAPEDGGFAENAFPPTVSDMAYHKDAWFRNDCLRCHETGVEEATVVKHQDLPALLLQAKCRSCHVLIPGMKPVERKRTKEEQRYAAWAFPPMIPASVSHQEAWMDDNCLLCHETGVRGAPVVKHKDLPALLLKAKCRSCHVQVRSANLPGR